MNQDKMNRYKAFLVFAFFLVKLSGGFAQTYEAGVFGGASNYLGDMNPYYDPSSLIYKPGIAGGAFVRYNHTKHLSLRLSALHGEVSGAPDNVPDNYVAAGIDRFRTSVTELSLKGEVNFLPYVAGDPSSLLTPFIFGGTGGFVFKDVDDSNKFRRLSYIFGLGVKFHVTNAVSAGIDWGMRSTTTNKLDGVYLDYHGGNPKNDDWYSFSGINVTIRFKDRSSAVCPY